MAHLVQYGAIYNADAIVSQTKETFVCIYKVINEEAKYINPSPLSLSFCLCGVLSTLPLPLHVSTDSSQHSNLFFLTKEMYKYQETTSCKLHSSF